MKRLLLILYLATAAAGGAQAATQYRDFTSAEGKIIRGCIRAYDARTKTVTIERDNKRTSKVPITGFSDDDQAYIQDYEVLKNFHSKRVFRISVDDDTRKINSNDSLYEIKTKLTKYEILLENRAISELPKLEMEYCIYYEQEEHPGTRKVFQQGVLFEKIDIGNMTPKSEETLQTKEVRTYRKTLSDGYIYTSGAGAEQRGRVLGIWIRIHMTLSTGEKHMREYCFPSGLNNKQEWSTESVRAGNN